MTNFVLVGLLIKQPITLSLLKFLLPIVKTLNALTHSFWALHSSRLLILVVLGWNRRILLLLFLIESWLTLFMILLCSRIFADCTRKLLELFNKWILWITKSRSWTWSCRLFLLSLVPLVALKVIEWRLSILKTGSVTWINLSWLTNFHGTCMLYCWRVFYLLGVVWHPLSVLLLNLGSSIDILVEGSVGVLHSVLVVFHTHFLSILCRFVSLRSSIFLSQASRSRLNRAIFILTWIVSTEYFWVDTKLILSVL